MAAQLNISQSTFSNWERGNYEPDNESLGKLADVFGVTIDYLLGRLEKPHHAPEKKPSRRIPVLGEVPAGIPIEAIEEVLDWEEIGEDLIRGGHEYIGLLVKGDSMEPVYLNGDTLIIRLQPCADTGDDAVVFVNGEDATFKRITSTPKGLTLRPLNPNYEPLFFTNQEIEELPVRVLGIAVEVRRKIR
jgi:repressor LexA